MLESAGEPVVGLNSEEKKYLLKLARETIITLLEKDEFPQTRPISEKVKEKFGAFVTLHKDGRLRGCIGYIEGVKPLYQTIMEMAKSAAFNDPRFPPVKKNEVKHLEIEISVLSPIKQIDNPEIIEVGKHGLIIQRGYYRGLLLPQVATEWGWDREEFLQQTCFKAGLPGDAWKDPDTKIFIFTAEIFSEKEFAEKD
ncbi:MAG: AmmeMemoRadiSam system protein A [Calditrichia bacterium]